ncbi:MULTISPECIES: dynamin family protein [Shewanella]|uniref:dynamin family protein n=1 Tax=Shewanella TaxID=22 RepID=UPI00201AEC11|nr:MULTISPECIES: dynamin family protein [Shewanella]
MERRKLVAFSETLHKLADSHQDLFGTELAQFKRMNAIDSPQQLEQTFQAVQEQNRLMNIGIVGRVKAGKSSLLNALIFDGEPILPKAATPMTAALTTITWGEAFQAKVEFFSEKDISIIKNKAEQYKTRLDKRTQECLEELIKRRSKQQPHGSPISDNKELINMASRRAQSELQREEALFAAYDQYQRMQSSGSARSPQNFQSDIQANNPKELAERLHEYVGAKGEFMPFTKSVHVFMPLEALRDICIIDTPGMNDPVQSREERTVELLKTCDVVFIVSPAGQFLNEQDLEVMGRITQKQGIQELVLIASQVDTQLYGSEKRARLSDALNNIRDQLSVRAQSTLAALKQSNPEVGSVFDNLINSARSNLLHSSGLCHSLNRRFDTPESWDSNEKTTWENLTGNYADYFNRENSTLSLNSLDSLANIAAIKDVLAQVREKKAAIIQDKLANLSISTRKSLQAFQHQLISLASNQIALIKNADVEQLNAQLNELKYKQSELALELDPCFNETMFECHKKLRDEMRKVASNLRRESKDMMENAESAYSETRTIDNDGLGSWFARILWGGGTTEVKVCKLITSHVESTLIDFINDIQYELGAKVEGSRYMLNKKLSENLTPKIREILEKDTNGQMIKQAILSVIQAIPDDNFNLGIELPEELKNRGILKDSEAVKFKDVADDFVGSLGGKVENKISTFIDNVKLNAPTRISDSFVNEVQRKINALKDQINHAAQTIDRLKRLLRKCEEVVL